MGRSARSVVFPLAATILVLGVATMITAIPWADIDSRDRGIARVGDMLPRVLASHVDRFKALPSQGGLGGPESAAEENFFARAFPDDDIPVARLDAARAAAEATAGRGFPTGKGRPGTWVTIGPSNAVYPFFEFRTAGLYVPNEYVAGGRTTTMAIDPNCSNGH